MEAKLARLLPVKVYRALIRRDVTSFVYHMVSPDSVDYVRHIYPSKTPEEFEQDLLFIREHFNPVTYGQLLDHTEGRGELPKNACLLTMDDGYRECFTEAAPLLRKHEVPCIFFVTTGFLDNRLMFYRNKYSLCVDAIERLSPTEGQDLIKGIETSLGHPSQSLEEVLAWLRSLKRADEGNLDQVCSLLGIDIEATLRTRSPYLTTGQVKSLLSDGFSIGAHSVRHSKFLDLEQEAIKREILSSCRVISELSGKNKVPFAFPFSGFGVDRNLLADLRRNNPEVGIFFDTQGLQPGEPFIVNRIWADPPAEQPGSGSNLGELLHEEYQRYVLWRREYYASMVAYKLGRQRY